MILLWGSNARETHPIFFHHVLKAIHNGARLMVIDPRRSASAQWADLWLGLDVGGDIALANAVAREIIHEGLTDERFIANATSGYEEYAASVEPYTLEEGERLLGSAGGGDSRAGPRLRPGRPRDPVLDARDHRASQRESTTCSR